MAQITTTRQERGQAIAQGNNQVSRIDECLYIVKSQSGHGEYTVNKINGEWFCDCPDNTYRHVPCKHIHAVNFSLSIRAEVKVQTIAPIDNLTNCIYCGSSNLVKKGIRKNKSGNIQKYLCQDCHKYMTFNVGFERMTHNPQAITASLELYFGGESLRSTQRALELMGVKVSYRTILNWIKKYTRLMKAYTEKIKPTLSDTICADEVYIRMGGNLKYLFAMMDTETRFWIGARSSRNKRKTRYENLILPS